MSDHLCEERLDVLDIETASQVTEYLEQVVRNCVDLPESSNIAASSVAEPIDECAAAVFRLLTHRRFCYLSKKRVEQYRDSILTVLNRQISAQQPLHFFYDIGGGYRASISPGTLDLQFAVGLAELLVLSQIVTFQRKLLSLYPHGARFTLVVDNLCALLVNDIPVDSTINYCAALRSLIQELTLQTNIDVLVESERFSALDYRAEINQIDTAKTIEAPSLADIENVSRFIGRPCSRQEAARRIAAYKDVTEISESHLSRLTNGIRMTQRASASTISFRPFPGADSRVQSGDVVMTRNANGKIVPLLLTSRTFDNFHLHLLATPASFPPSISELYFASKVPT